MGFLINGERVLPVEMLSMLICFGAVIMIAFASQQPELSDSAVVASSSVGVGMTIAILSAWCLASQNVMTRVLKDIDAMVIMFYVGLVGFIFYTAVNILTGGFTVIASFTTHEIQELVLAISFDLIANLAANKAYQMSGSGFVSLISYLTIFYGFSCDFFFFDKIFSVTETSAICMILVVTVLTSIYKLRL